MIIPAAAVAAAALALAGCGSAPAPGPSPAPSGSRPASPGTSRAFAGTALFPIAAGRTWTYDAVISTQGGANGGGAGRSVVTERVASVAPVSGGHQVTFAERATGPSGGTDTLTYTFRNDGSIIVPFAAGSGLTGSARWPSPAVLASGKRQVYYLLEPERKAGGMVLTRWRVTIQGMGARKVRVPAGSFRATEVYETVTTGSGAGAKGLAISAMLAPWVGPVQLTEAASAGAAMVLITENLKSVTG